MSELGGNNSQPKPNEQTLAIFILHIGLSETKNKCIPLRLRSVKKPDSAKLLSNICI